jgi:hypothetical protein
MADSFLNFATYSCFEIPTSTITAVAGTLSTAAYIYTLTVTNSPPGVNYVLPNLNTSPIMEVYGLSTRSYNWGTNAYKY